MNRQTFRLVDGIEIDLLPSSTAGDHNNSNENAGQQPQVILDVEHAAQGFVGLDLTNFTGRLEVKKVEKRQLSTPQAILSSSVPPLVVSDENQDSNDVSIPPRVIASGSPVVQSPQAPRESTSTAMPHVPAMVEEVESRVAATAASSSSSPRILPIISRGDRGASEEEPETHDYEVPNDYEFVMMQNSAQHAVGPHTAHSETAPTGTCSVSTGDLLDDQFFFHHEADNENEEEDDDHFSLGENMTTSTLDALEEEQTQRVSFNQQHQPASSPPPLASDTGSPSRMLQKVPSRVSHGTDSIHKAPRSTMGSNVAGSASNGPRRGLDNSTLRRRVSVRTSLLGSVKPATASGDRTIPPPTRLHEACANGLITFPELVRTLQAQPEAIRIKDTRGRLPLHVLGDNDELLGTAQGRQVATSFAQRLMYAYPSSVGSLNQDGFMPFMNIIDDWLLWIYETYDKVRQKNNARHCGPGGGGVKGALLSLGKKVSKSDNEDIHLSPGAPSAQEESLAAPKNSRNVATAASTITSSAQEKSSLMENSVRAFPPRVDIWEEVEWCFQMLSSILDEFGGACKIFPPPNPRKNFARKKKKIDKREELVKHVVHAFPNLLRTVLLLDGQNGNTRKRILRMSLFRRMLLCPDSVGDWITRMLRRGGAPSRRAVDYFELVSETKVADHTGGFLATTKENVEAFQASKIKVYCAIENLKGTVSSLVMLQNRERERAAATAVIWNILNCKLSRPFVLSLVIIDLVLHIILLLAFRHVASIGSHPDQKNASDNVIDPSELVLLISAHYVMRVFCEVYALFTVSPRVLRNYFTDVWKLFDLIAIVLTIIATLYQRQNSGQRYLNGLNALVVGLLWFKMLGFLKVINRQMSTFILALIRILCDIRYFMVVMLCILFLFGDMLHFAVSTKDGGEFCLQDELADPTLDFCDPSSAGPSYLRVYSMLIGDYELSDLRDTPAITILFVIFTLIAVVIMLNILIAVVSDSYEKATISSSLMFGGARVVFTAGQESLETLLKPNTRPLTSSSSLKNFGTASWRLFWWLLLLAIIATACMAEYYIIIVSIRLLQDRESIGIAIVLTFMAALMAAALWVVIVFALDGFGLSQLHGRLARGYEGVNRINMSLIGFIANPLFGLHKRGNGIDVNEDESTEEDWLGRINYLEKRIEGMVEDATNDIADKIDELEERLTDPNDREARTIDVDAVPTPNAEC